MKNKTEKRSDKSGRFFLGDPFFIRQGLNIKKSTVRSIKLTISYELKTLLVKILLSKREIKRNKISNSLKIELISFIEMI